MNIFLMVFIAALFCAAIPYPKICCLGAVEVEAHDDLRFPICDFRFEELVIIKKAAERNKCRGDDFLILLAIRKAENGGWGREFGVKHRLCRAAMNKWPAETLDIQAGWAAATIVKNRRRWELATDEHRLTQIENKNTVQSVKSVAKNKEEFIDFLGDRYCPIAADPQGNKNWKTNVKYFYSRFKGEQND